MATPDTFTWIASYSTGATKTPKLMVAQYNDGYSQRVADGINNNPDTINLVFSSREQLEADAIMAFFDAHADGSAFYLCVETGDPTILVYVKTYKKSWVSNDNYTVTATVIQVFDYII